MATRYMFDTSNCSCGACGPKQDPHGVYVTATDYDATEAERDELKRRLDAIIGHAHAHTLESWAHDMLAIAEGRDNG